jgi:CarD family transcriptional regulator
MIFLYNVGQYVICASGGVWFVSTVDGENIHLTEHETGKIKTVCVSDKEIIREIASKQEIVDVIERVGYIRTIQAPNDKIRREFYEEAMMKYDEVEWVKVIKSVYLRKETGRLMHGESEYSDKAKGFLHNEISVVLGIPASEVEQYIENAVSSNI